MTRSIIYLEARATALELFIYFARVLVFRGKTQVSVAPLWLFELSICTSVALAANGFAHLGLLPVMDLGLQDPYS